MQDNRYYGQFGGQYVSESLMNTLNELEKAFDEAMKRKGDGVLFCVGSLYLVGSLKSLIRSRKNA